MEDEDCQEESMDWCDGCGCLTPMRLFDGHGYCPDCTYEDSEE
jgi:hypothetical protein